MASYTELFNLMQGKSELRNRITVAVIVAAEEIRTEDAGTANHANRLLWAARAFDSPESISKKIMMSVIAGNKAAAISAIEAATDAVLQAAVNSSVDLFATGA